MSRGLGRIQRAVLALITGGPGLCGAYTAPGTGLTVHDLAARIHGDGLSGAATDAQYRSVARAVRRLKALGLLDTYRVSDGRRRLMVRPSLTEQWAALAEAADAGSAVIINGDCRVELPRLPACSVDMAYLDPPFNLQMRSVRPRRAAGGSLLRGPVGEWDCFESMADYDAYMRPVLEHLLRVLKPTGSLWVGGPYHCIHRLATQLQDMGAWFLGEIIWWIANAPPRAYPSPRPPLTHQTLLWVARNRDCASTVERVLDGGLHAEHTGRDFNLQRPVSIWRIPVCQGSERLRREDGSALHPAQKPIELLRRIIRLSTRPGGIVLDPMAGTGTTGEAACRLGRRAVQIELDAEYCAAARSRLAAPMAASLQPMRQRHA